MVHGIDHVLVAVESLDRAAEVYQALGLDVYPGGVHPDHGTHNALVPLADGSYLELMGIWDEDRASRQAHTRLVLDTLDRENRLALFALDVDEIEEDVARIRERGLAVGDPVPGERERPDGERVRWRTAHPDEPRLPFLIQDETSRSLRVPRPSEGVGTELRLARLVLGHPDPAEAEAELGKLLGREPASAAEGAFRTDRGELRIVSGQTPYAPERLVLAADPLDAVAEAWSEQGAAFAESETRDGRRALAPRATAGVPLYVTPRSRP